MKRIHTTILFSATVACLLLGSCHNAGEKETAKTAKDSTAPAKRDDDIELTDEQMRAVGVETGFIEQKNLHAVVKANGQLTVAPQNRANVSVLIGGVISNIAIIEGNYVKRGQVLATIENPEFIKMQQDYLTSKNDFSFTEKEYQRQKELQEQNAGTGKVFQQAAATYYSQQAKLASLEKQLQQINVNIAELQKGHIVAAVPVLAPIHGTVGHITINTGAFADPAKSIMDIVDNSRIYCDLYVFERDLFKVKPGQKASLLLTNQNGKQLSAEIYGVNRSFENDSKTVIVHAALRNADNSKLIPGLYVTALIDVGNQLVSAVPVEAIIRTEDKDYIYLVVDKPADTGKHNKGEPSEKTLSFKKVEVATGITELEYTEIAPLSEIPAGSKVVTKGAFYILSKAKSGNADDLN